jgi:glycosyltransferase involved in cell wall biosynthesis
MFTSNAYGRAAALLAGAPIRVATELSVDEWKWWLYRLVDRLLLPFTDAVIANAAAVRHFYMTSERVPAYKIALIRNGIDLNVFQPRPKQEARARLGIPLHAKVVGGAGRLDLQKGFSILVEAMQEVLRKHPETLLVIAGDGPERPALEAQAARLGFGGQVRLLGHAADMAGFMSAIDVFALSSLWEGLPHVVMEAMACERPVVAARIGGVGELVKDGETGLLVQPRSPTALARAIIRLFDQPDALIQMGRSARLVAQRDFDFMKMVRQTEELYLSLMERRGLCVAS